MMDRRAFLQLMVLLLALPAQFLLTKYMGSTSETGRNHALQKILTSAVSVRNRYFSWRAWQKWCLALVSDFQGRTEDDVTGHHGDQEAESLAVEVLNYRNKDGHFASSPDVRTKRPKNVLYRIGQVIKHKRWGYRGVIVGWDPVTKIIHKEVDEYFLTFDGSQYIPRPWLQSLYPDD